MGRLDLKALGERGLVELIRRRAGSRQSGWRVAIGDDAAVMRAPQGQDLVYTSDTLVEGTHFRWSTTRPRALGRKTLAVNLSDLGAMGATPRGFLLNWTLPESSSASQIDGFLRGLLQLANRAKCPLVGGDTVAGPVWTMSVTAIGSVPMGKGLLRSTAKVGDRLMVTGTLGAASLGLYQLEAGRKQASIYQRRQLDPAPPYELGRRLLRSRGMGAALDLSDGLATDLERICLSSEVGAEVDLELIPVNRGFHRSCDKENLNPWELVLFGGEDYELLFTVRADASTASKLTRQLGHRVTEIGRIVRGRRPRFRMNGKSVSIPGRAFEHFKTR